MITGVSIVNNEQMKMKHLLAGIFLIPLFIFILSACDDDEKEENSRQIIGEWKVSNLSTDNNALNTALPLLLLSEGIDIAQSGILFSEDGIATITLFRQGKEPIILHPLYAYENDQLAFRFDEILPIPFNAFDVKTLTQESLTLESVVSPEILNLLLTLLKNESAEIGAMLEQLLGASLTEGLVITLQMQR